MDAAAPGGLLGGRGGHHEGGYYTLHYIYLYTAYNSTRYMPSLAPLKNTTGDQKATFRLGTSMAATLLVMFLPSEGD